jgi:basic amino acid/polyamine antiporter, APA family
VSAPIRVSALTYAELGVMFPRAGGEYVFLREGLGPLLAFMSGWTAFTINLAGSAAALALIFAEQLNALKPPGFDPLVGPAFSTRLTAASLILLLATVNHFGLRYGAGVQKTFTVLKGGLMVFLAAAALLYAGEPATPRAGFFEEGAGGASFAGFLAPAMVAALFAYDGWTNVVRVGSEIKDPARNLPRAMLFYILLSLGYLHVLGLDGFAQSPRTVASDTARVLFGPTGQGLVAALILVSVFGSLNGITISGPRIYYAMARDGLFPRPFGGVNRHHTPGRAIWAQAALGILFLFLFDFDKLTDNVVFISFLFYALAAVGLLVLRRTHPHLPRPYKVPGYPVVPILFVVASLAFVAYLVYDQFARPGDGLYRVLGLTIVAAGLPVYFFFRAKQRRSQAQA